MRQFFMAVVLAAVCAPALHGSVGAAEAPPYDPAEALPGGAATAIVDDPTAAFSRPVGNLPEAERARFLRGADLFYTRWIAGPAPPPALTGLGPLYNALSCEQCHVNDGRGRPPSGADVEVTGAVLRFATAFSTYGAQLQDHAIQGHEPEGDLSLSAIAGHGADEPISIPMWKVGRNRYGPFPTQSSIVVAPPMIGLGLLAAIPEIALRSRADPDDANGDGISGKLGAGRFGWRATAESIVYQTAHAFAHDMGVSNRLFPDAWGDCTSLQRACRDGAGDGIEASDEIVTLVANYVANLGPPERPNAGAPDVLAGRSVFYEIGCAGCHTPMQDTDSHALVWFSNQRIWPYSDLLLHDMGDALADGGGREWRTPPLWGLGRHKAVNGNAYFLHDGRAGSILQAILWHGGEAAAARDAVKALPTDRRASLLAFLNSL